MSTAASSKTKRIALISIILLTLVTTLTLLYIKNVGDSTDSSVLVKGSGTPTLTVPSPQLPDEPTETNQVPMRVNLEQADTNQSGQLVVKQRPDWKQDGSLNQHFEALKLAADNGDEAAAHILAMNLRHCYSSVVTEVEFDEVLSDAYENNDSSNRIRFITERFDYCKGINKEQRSQFYKYFEIAANLGFVPTQEVIANITPKLFMESQGYAKLERKEFLKKRDQFIQQKLSYLESASQQGSLRAINQLSGMYYSQNYGSGGFLKAFVLNQAVLELTDDDNRYNRFSRYQQNLHNKLSPEDVDKGLSMSKELLEKIKQKGTLYSF
jgi:hypothetical protein